MVWLGSASEDSEQAIQIIRASARWQASKCSGSESFGVSASDRAAVVSLLERSWFERIWVSAQVQILESILNSNTPNKSPIHLGLARSRSSPTHHNQMWPRRYWGIYLPQRPEEVQSEQTRQRPLKIAGPGPLDLLPPQGSSYCSTWHAIVWRLFSQHRTST